MGVLFCCGGCRLDLFDLGGLDLSSSVSHT